MDEQSWTGKGSRMRCLEHKAKESQDIEELITTPLPTTLKELHFTTLAGGGALEPEMCDSALLLSLTLICVAVPGQSGKPKPCSGGTLLSEKQP